jgi:hypothetical protein
MKRYLDFFVALVVVCGFTFLMAYTLLNWALGCGQSFPQADGTRIQGECVSPIELFDR